jgi:hypothetical protein
MAKKKIEKTPAEKAADDKIRQEKRAENLAIIKERLESGKITNFQGIFNFYPPTSIAKDLHMSPTTFKAKVHNPELFDSAEIKALAHLFETSFSVMQRFITLQTGLA